MTWGTNPGQALPLASSVPDPGSFADPAARAAAERALTYMDLKPGTALRDVAVDTVFVGSCTNGRIEDLRAAADGAAGPAGGADGSGCWWSRDRWPSGLRPNGRGSTRSSPAPGAEWRSAGCSMCLGMNPDTLSPGERSASTSNRNFEGRQGKGGRTHLVSPQVAAATAVTGQLAAPADL